MGEPFISPMPTTKPGDVFRTHSTVKRDHDALLVGVPIEGLKGKIRGRVMLETARPRIHVADPPTVRHRRVSVHHRLRLQPQHALLLLPFPTTFSRTHVVGVPCGVSGAQDSLGGKSDTGDTSIIKPEGT